jgi:hypothetical protein
MLKDAQTSLALLLQEIQNHRLPKYMTQQKIIQLKPTIKFAATREVRRTRAVTDSTPSTETNDPTPVPMEKRSKGGGVAKKRKKIVVLPTANNSPPPRATREEKLH